MNITITLADSIKVGLGIALGYKLKTQIQAGINSIKKALSGLLTVKA